MEKYAAGCRLILCCNNQSKVIDPVRSRCLGIRVPSPSHDEVSFVLFCHSSKEFYSTVFVTDVFIPRLLRCYFNEHRSALS